MSVVTDLFSQSYHEARERFLNACHHAGARVQSMQHPLPGPAGEALFCDVAEIGPGDASIVCLQIAGTHGVEGFLGSAVLIERLHATPPRNLRMVLVHGLNPWGFAHLTRFTENNVDLNRNFIDFSAGRPENSGYAHLHPIICPENWDEDTRSNFRTALAEFDLEHGPGSGLDATLRGQYSHPNGFNYGGAGPAWSHLCLRSICTELTSSTEAVLVIDWHTGLGKLAQNVLIPFAREGAIDAETFARFGLGHIAPVNGFPAYTGLVTEGVKRFLPHVKVCGLLAEFGIANDPWVNVDGLRFDHWLRFGNTAVTDLAGARRGLRDLYCPQDANWRNSAIGEASRLNRLIAGAAG